MATFQKRGKTWQYTISRYTDGKYDPIRKGGYRTKLDAKADADVIEGDMAQGLSPVLIKDVFADYFEEWVKDYKAAKAEVTYLRYLNSVNTVKEYFDKTSLQDMTKRKYQRFLNEYGEGHAYETVRKLNTHIRACAKDAVDEGRIRVDFYPRSRIQQQSHIKDG